MKMDVNGFDTMARTIFKPAYPLIADQILAHTGVTAGTCLDIGCGGGYLGIELARKSDLTIRFLDQSSQMLEIVKRNLAESGLTRRGETILANVEEIPLPDQSVDLAVSRGSIFFWEDLVAAFREIYRVLSPGGATYIGGGFGSASIREEIGRQMRARDNGDDKWRNMAKRNLGPETRQRIAQALQDAAIANHHVVHNEEQGLWVVMRKEN